MSSGIYKETGRATWDEIQRLRRRIEELEQSGASLSEVQALIRAGTDEGPVGTGDEYLRLDASNDPVTGALELNDALTVAGASDLNSTLDVEGLTTHSDMIHINAPTVGVASLRMAAGASFSTLSPDDNSLSGHELWMDPSNITASDGAEVVRWDSAGAPFSADGFTLDTNGPTFLETGGANSQPAVTFSTAQNHYLDSGTGHSFGGASTGATLFLVYKVSSSTSATGERGVVGGNNGDSTRRGMRPPGNNASAFHSFHDQASGSRITISDAVSTVPGLGDWCIAVFRKDTSDNWHTILGIQNGGTPEEASDGYSSTGSLNIKGIGIDKDHDPFTGVEMSEFIGYTADLGTDDTRKIYNYLAERYGLPTIANGAGAGSGGANQLDFVLAEDSGGTQLARLDTSGQLLLGAGTPSATLHVKGTALITGDTTLSGTVTIGNGASITGQITADSLQVNGKATITDTLDVQSTLSADVVQSSRDSSVNNPRVIVRDEKGTSNLNVGVSLRASDDSDKAFIGFNGNNNLRVENKFGNLLQLYTNAIERLRIDGSGNIFPFGKTRWNDNIKAAWGSADDAHILYDGTDLIVAPQNVGSGDLKVQGGAFVDVESTGFLRSGARFVHTAGQDGISTDTYLNGPDGIAMTADHGHVMVRDGSVVGLSYSNDRATVSAEGDITYEVRINGVSALSTTEHSTVSNSFATQARNVATFSAGDVLSMFVTTDADTFNGNVGIIMNAEVVVDE